MRLLIVEDNLKFSTLLADILTEGGFAVDVAVSVQDAEAMLGLVAYDALILDLGLPDGDGFDVLQDLRRRGFNLPVLVSTARSDLVERVRSLNAGADDYLVKPFSPEELLARIRALLRRPASLVSPLLAAGNIVLDTTQMMVSVANRPIGLPRRECCVLHALMLQAGRVLRRETLERSIYSFDADVTPNAIEVAVSRLRRRLELAEATVTITSMRGIGYILSENDPT